MITINEPLRGKDLLHSINSLASSHEGLFHVISILADIFVFAYPIILIWLFIIGYTKKNSNNQYGSLSVLWSTMVAVAINIVIQLFIRKDRPETLPWLKLILKHVPSVSFPSDHAAVSMAFAIGFYLFFQSSLKNRTIKCMVYFLFAASFVMGICRIAVAVHRPTDILVWWIIGIIWWYIGYTLFKTEFVRGIWNWFIKIGNHILDYVIPKKLL